MKLVHINNEEIDDGLVLLFPRECFLFSANGCQVVVASMSAVGVTDTAETTHVRW